MVAWEAESLTARRPGGMGRSGSVLGGYGPLPGASSATVLSWPLLSAGRMSATTGRSSWHMQARLAPVLFADDDKPAASHARPSPVAPAARSPRAWPRQPPSRPRPTCQYTASAACSPTWPPSASTPSRPPTPSCPASGSLPPPPRCSGTPSTCSASATALAPRSQAATSHHPKTPGKRPSAPIAGGTSVLRTRPSGCSAARSGTPSRRWGGPPVRGVRAG